MSSKKKKHNRRKKDNSQYENNMNEFNSENKQHEAENNEEAADGNNLEDALNDFFIKENISEADRQSIRLLMIQLRAIYIGIYADFLTLNSTLEGIQIILDKYDDKEDILPDALPDVLGLKATYLYLIARFLSIYVSFSRYNTVSQLLAKGEYKYTIYPNVFINNSNILGLIANIYSLRAATAIVNRDNIQPIYGL